MLIQFKVGNFLSFKDEVIFSMVGHNPVKEHEASDESLCNTIPLTDKIKLLKSTVLYGANGSGKSNLLKAIDFFRRFVLNSSNQSLEDKSIKVKRFLLSSETDDEPSLFEMIFMIDGVRYRYGFEVDEEDIHTEWLFSLKPNSNREAKLFTREFQEIDNNDTAFREGKNVAENNNTRPDALFLSTVAQFNGKVAQQILDWLKSSVNIISGLEDTTISYTINKFLKEDTFKDKVRAFFKSIRIGFEDIEILEEKLLNQDEDKVPEELREEMAEVLAAVQKLREKLNKFANTTSEAKEITINVLHKKFDGLGQFLNFESLDFGLESKGTQKLFSLMGPILDTIENNKILIIDELDARLHTLLSIELIKIFHSKANQGGQLIFASHDTSLLKKELFRRDQIWFTEKNDAGATDLYSLVEYKIDQTRVRNDASFEKDYLIGKYGAIPFLSNIQKFVNDFLYEQKQEKEQAKAQ